MADIDHFKQFNDTHGHDTGDDVLRIVAQELAKVRGGGKAFRYGGEEFTLLFKRKTTEEAEPFIERIRKDIADYPLMVRDQQTRPKIQSKKGRNSKSPAIQVQVTVSFGIAQRLPEQRSEDVMKQSDQALYRAKEQGRNCISC
jgi:GGDEF domain-containing protein